MKTLTLILAIAISAFGQSTEAKKTIDTGGVPAVAPGAKIPESPVSLQMKVDLLTLSGTLKDKMIRGRDLQKMLDDNEVEYSAILKAYQGRIAEAKAACDKSGKDFDEKSLDCIARPANTETLVKSK